MIMSRVIRTTFKKGQRFAIDKKVYELNQDLSISMGMSKCFMNGKEIDLRDYATYVEPFDEGAWLRQMAKSGFHFNAGVGLIFF